MKAAVLHAADRIPTFQDFPEPALLGGEVTGRILAAGLHPLVRGHATGSHYSSTGTYPLIPGVDGVAELPDGRRVYTGWLRAPYGTFAERAAVDLRSLDVPRAIDPALVAGIVNPAMSSWLALRLRAKLVAGETVMVLGATGSSGRLAVQLARALGAGRVIAVGRDREKLCSLDAEVRAFDEVDLSDVDIVLDYVWGAPAMTAMQTKRGPRRLRFVNIGQSAGDTAAFSPHALRSSNLELIGSGLGSVQPHELLAELPGLLAMLPALTFDIAPTPLSDVAAAWTRDSSKRIVLVN